MGSRNKVLVMNGLLTMAAAGCAKPDAAIVLADREASTYQIVLPPAPIASERHAAEELQRFCHEMSGATLSVVAADAPAKDTEIILGNHPRLKELGVPFDAACLGKEGYLLRTVGRRVVIAGGQPRGTLYGVYALLEEQLGCRWFSSKVSRIPKHEKLMLPPMDETYVPPLEYRESFYTDAFDGDWAARNRMNSNRATLADKHGGKIAYGPFVHTFYHLVPPSKYFKDHPEYFSLTKGERRTERSQLCLTNPDVLGIVVTGVRRWIKAHPHATIFSVSQNDWHGFCECADCKAIDEAEGSHAGSLIWFVNKVAEAIEQDHPDVAIDTLAYQYTRKPPKSIRPRQNVIVRLCSIECCFAHPLATDDYLQNRSFREDITAWSKLTRRLYVWDYVTNFAHYIMPFPNFDVLAPNIRFFVEHGVRGIFEQGNYCPGGKGEFAELRAYVVAKLLWKPDRDPQRAIDEFMKGYYGKAAGPIRAYLDLLHEGIRASGCHLRIFQGPDRPYLAPEFITQAQLLFDEAERLADEDQVLRRVRIARLPVQYVMLVRPTRRVPGRGRSQGSQAVPGGS